MYIYYIPYLVFKNNFNNIIIIRAIEECSAILYCMTPVKKFMFQENIFIPHSTLKENIVLHNNFFYRNLKNTRQLCHRSSGSTAG